MAENYFELVGKITWVDFQTYDSGTCVCKTFLSQRTSKKDIDGKPIYNSFLISFIDSANNKKQVASEYYSRIKKDDYVRIKGYISVNKFIPKNSTKEVEQYSFVGLKFNKVEWDELEKRYVDEIS